MGSFGVTASAEEGASSIDCERAAVRWCEASEKLGHGMYLIACGALHSLAACSLLPPDYAEATADARRDALHTFGSNNAGQLGIGNRTMKNTPQLVTTLWHWDGVQSVADVQCGAKHSAAIVVQGGVREMWTWGQGWYGRLGHGNEMHRFNPKRIAAFGRTSIASCSLGSSHTAAITEDGELFLWGWNEHGQLGIGLEGGCRMIPMQAKLPGMRKAASVALGREHSLVLATDGSVFAAGANEFGQLGVRSVKHGNRADYSTEFLPVAGMPRIRQVACGGHHSLAVTIDGHVFGWGSAYKGRLGLAKLQTDVVLAPRRLYGLENIREIVPGDAHTLAVTNDGRVFAFGLNKYRQCGILQPGLASQCVIETPILLQHLRGVSRIAAAGSCAGGHSLALILGARQVIHQHIRDGNAAAVVAVLEAIVPDERMGVVQEEDEEGMTALHWAAAMGDIKSAKAILDVHPMPSRLAKIVHTSSGWTALHMAAKAGAGQLSAMLLRNVGCSPTPEDKRGRSPLHLAVIAKKIDCALDLMREANKRTSGVSLLCLRDSKNKRPLDYASAEDAFRLKAACGLYSDVGIIASTADQLTSLIKDVLKSKFIKATMLPGGSGAQEDAERAAVFAAASGVIFLVDDDTIGAGSDARRALDATLEHDIHLFPAWQKKMDLPVGLESVLFRFQLTDLADCMTHKQNMQGLAIAINARMSLPRPKKKQSDNRQFARNDDDAAHSAVAAADGHLQVFLAFDEKDRGAATALTAAIGCLPLVTVVGNGSHADAKHANAVVVLLSSASLESNRVREQLSVAENNKKPIFGLLLERDLHLPADFAYTLALTPTFYMPSSAGSDLYAMQLVRHLTLLADVEEASVAYHAAHEQYRCLLQAAA